MVGTGRRSARKPGISSRRRIRVRTQRRDQRRGQRRSQSRKYSKLRKRVKPRSCRRSNRRSKRQRGSASALTNIINQNQGSAAFVAGAAATAAVLGVGYAAATKAPGPTPPTRVPGPEGPEGPEGPTRAGGPEGPEGPTRAGEPEGPFITINWIERFLEDQGANVPILDKIKFTHEYILQEKEKGREFKSILKGRLNMPGFSSIRKLIEDSEPNEHITIDSIISALPSVIRMCKGDSIKGILMNIHNHGASAGAGADTEAGAGA